MSAVARRQRLLREFGVVPYRLRQVAPVASVEEPVGRPSSDGAVVAECVLVLPAACQARERDLIGRAMSGFGAAFARAARVEVGDGMVSGDVPVARAYLAFGEAQARALGLSLPAEVMATADVILLDPPGELLQAAGKRRLWAAVNALRRRWRQAQAGGE